MMRPRPPPPSHPRRHADPGHSCAVDAGRLLEEADKAPFAVADQGAGSMTGASALQPDSSGVSMTLRRAGVAFTPAG